MAAWNSGNGEAKLELGFRHRAENREGEGSRGERELEGERRGARPGHVIHARPWQGASRSSGSELEFVPGRYSVAGKTTEMILLGAPCQLLWFSQVGPFLFYFCFLFISFQYLIYLGKQMNSKNCKFYIVGKLVRNASFT